MVVIVRPVVVKIILFFADVASRYEVAVIVAVFDGVRGCF